MAVRLILVGNGQLTIEQGDHAAILSSDAARSSVPRYTYSSVRVWGGDRRDFEVPPDEDVIRSCRLLGGWNSAKAWPSFEYV